MPQRIDHVILAGPDLAALERVFIQLGFRVTGGGEHPHLGTRNRIILLGEGYLELLAVADPERASPFLQRFIAEGGGWVGYALQSSDIAAETRAMLARGVDARGPTPGRLVAPDGSARGWQVTVIGSDDPWRVALPLPFLIQHNTTGEAHRRALAGADSLAPHPNGATQIANLQLTCADLADLARRYTAAYGFPTASGDSAGYALADGEVILLHQAPHPGAVSRGAEMTVRVRVGDLAAIEALRWHTTVGRTNTERFLSIPIPDVKAPIEVIASRAGG